MLSQPVIEFTQIRAFSEAVVNIACVELHRKLYYSGFHVYFLFHPALFKVKVFL